MVALPRSSPALSDEVPSFPSLDGRAAWFHIVAGTSLLYLAVAVAGGLVFLWRTIELLRRPNSVQAMKVFHFSIIYLGALFVAVAVDVLVYGASA